MMNFDHAKKISTLESIQDLNLMLGIQSYIQQTFKPSPLFIYLHLIFDIL